MYIAVHQMINLQNLPQTTLQVAISLCLVIAQWHPASSSYSIMYNSPSSQQLCLICPHALLQASHP